MANSLYGELLSGRNDYKTYQQNKLAYIKQLREREKQQEEAERKKLERENASFWKRLGASLIDQTTEVIGGALKGIEGVVDAAVSIAGGIGGVFGADTKWAEDIIKFDATNEWYYEGFENDLTNLSYLNTERGITKNILRGVGQMLPSVAMNIVAPGSGIVVTTASAGGSGVEEALSEDAEYGEALAYGVAIGGIEALTEKIGGKLFGESPIDDALGVKPASKTLFKRASSSVGKLAQDALGEGIEEGLSEMVNPALKSIYKGTDSFKEYGSSDFWKGVGESALVGAGTSMVYGETVGRITKTLTNADAVEDIQELATLDEKADNLYSSGNLTLEQANKIEEMKKETQTQLSEKVSKMSAERRAKFIQKHNLSGMLNEDGSLVVEQATEIDNNTYQKPNAEANILAYSPSLKNTKLILQPTSNALSVESNNIKQVVSTLNKISRVQIKTVFTDQMSSNEKSFYDPSTKVIYFSTQATQADITQTLTGHEFAHSLEGTKEYAKMAKYIAEHTPNFDELVAKKLAQYSQVNQSSKEGEVGKYVSQYEAETEVIADEIGKLLSNPDSVQRVVNQNISLAQRLVQWVKDAIARLTKRGVQGEYYNYLRNAEKMLSDAMKHSVGGIKLTDVANIFGDRLAKQGVNSEIVANSSQSDYNEGNRYLLNNYKRIEGLDENNIPLKLQDGIINYLNRESNSERSEEARRENNIGFSDDRRNSSIDGLRRIQKTLSTEEFNYNPEAIKTLCNIIIHNKFYTERIVDDLNLNIVDNDILPAEFRELQQENDFLGINTFFYVNQEINNPEFKIKGFQNNKDIYIGLSSYSPDFIFTNKHERIHYLKKHYNKFYTSFANDIRNIMTKSEEEKLYNKYYKIYKKSYNLTEEQLKNKNSSKVWEEIIAQIYSGNEVLSNKEAVYDAIESFEKKIRIEFTMPKNIRFSLNNQIDTVWGKGYSVEDVNVDEYNVINFKESTSIEKFEQLLKDISGAVKQNLSLVQTAKTRVDLFNLLKQQENRVYSKLGEINDAFNQVKEEYTKNKDININQEFIKALGYNGLVSKNNTADSVIYDLSMKKRNLLDFSTERAQERRDKAIKLFGETDNPANAGWLLADGRFVDYNRSSENIFNKSENFVLDYNDHTQIEDVYDSKRGYDAIDSFMAEGNIRLMPEAGGIELRNKPTTSQIGALKKYIDALIDKQGITVDLRKPNTTENVLPNYVYYESTQTANTIIDDINSFYNNDGKMPRTIEGVRWSRTDNLGNELTKEQQEYFKDSKVRDSEGNLLVMYHGTGNNDFTIFDIDKSKNSGLLGKGFYFTVNKTEASERYQKRNGRLIKAYLNIKKPLEVSLVHKSSLISALRDEFAGTFDIDSYVYNSKYKDGVDTNKLLQVIKKQGYDGIFNKEKGYYVAFESNQIKLVSNKEPSLNDDIRFSLKDGTGDYNYSKGQIAKYVAEHSKLKAYSRSDAEKIVNTIVADQLSYGSKYGELSGKTKKQAIDTLWHALNTNNEGYRAKAALDIADFIINNAIMENIYADKQNESDMFVIGELKEYLHNVDLSGIKGEIKYTYDKDNSPYLLWGARKGTKGIAPDKIALELQERGLYIDALNEGEIFIEMDKMYRDSVKNLKRESKKKLSELMSKEELHDLQQSIAKEVMIGYDTTGYKTLFAQTIEKYTNKISELKKTIIDLKAYNKAKNNTISTIERLRDEFVKNKPAGWKTPQQVVDFVKKIAKVETWRNNISHTAREHLRDLQLQIDSVMDETQQKIYPYREILQEIAMGKGELSTDELITLDNILRQFAWQLRNYDQVEFEGKTQSNTELAEQGVKESKQAKNILKSGSNVLIKFKNKVYTNPYDRLAEMGLYRENSIAMRLYRDMLQGDRRRADLLKQTNDLFNTFFDKNKTYLKDLQKQITIGTGDNKLTLTKRQALSIYCTSLREQGRNHLFNQSYDSGVIHLLDNKLSTQGKTLEAFSKGVDVIINESMISEIENSLTASDKGYLEIVDKFFNKISKESKKEVDQKLYGVTNIESGYYFPIKVSKDKIYTEAGQNNTDINQYILEMGMNKSVKPNAQNKIVIDGIDNIVATHLQNISLYYGYAIPLTAYNRIMNKQVDSEGRDATSNMRAEIQKIDADFEGYMDRLWQDIQGIRKADKDFLSSLLSKIRWAGANSALGANPKVLVTQTLSLAAAVSEFNPKYVTKGMAHFFGEKEKLELAKYSSLMWERMQIGHSTDVTEIRQIGKEIGAAGKITAKATKFLNDFTTKPISWMDSNVIQSLWFAAQYEIADIKGKGYEFGTEANKIEAGKRLDEVVFRTQQTSDPLGRSEWMRSKNEFVKFARMFTGDALQLTGRLISSVNKYNIAKKMLKSGDSALVEQANKMMVSAKTGVTKASSAFILNQVMLLAIALAFKWIKGKDDDEEWSEIAQNEVVANLMGLIPFGGDIYDKLSGYEPTNMAYTALSNSVDVVIDLYDGFSGFIKGEYTSDVKCNAIIRKSVLSVSRLLGIPAQNLESYTMGIIGKVSPKTKEEYESKYQTKTNKVYLEKINQATEAGDEELAETYINLMFNSKTGKIKDDVVMDTTRELIELGYDVVPKAVGTSITYDSVEYTLTKKQHNNFTKIYSQSTESIKNMVNSYMFKKLDDEAKAKAMNYVYNYYYNLAIEDLLGEDIDSKMMLFGEAIPIEQLAIAISQAQLYKAYQDKNGGILAGTKKRKVQAFIQSMRLTAAQKYMIMGYLGYSNENGASQVKSYINSLRLTKTQKEELYKMSGYKS